MLAYLNKQAQIKGSKANKHQQEIEGKIRRQLRLDKKPTALLSLACFLCAVGFLSMLAYLDKQA
jgi:hypothetical protein